MTHGDEGAHRCALRLIGGMVLHRDRRRVSRPRLSAEATLQQTLQSKTLRGQLCAQAPACDPVSDRTRCVSQGQHFGNIPLQVPKIGPHGLSTLCGRTRT